MKVHALLVAMFVLAMVISAPEVVSAKAENDEKVDGKPKDTEEGETQVTKIIFLSIIYILPS